MKNRPRTATFCPARFAMIVRLQSSRHIFRHTNIKFAFGILKNVNAISHRDSKRLVAGAGFEPATFRL
jgi:hypothetical protein